MYWSVLVFQSHTLEDMERILRCARFTIKGAHAIRKAT
jgi:hypothetical protein